MKHRRFGRTGLSVPAITFGGGWVGGVLIHGGQETANAALDMAMDAGMDWIDGAADYGGGASEIAIGRWLATCKADNRPNVTSKFRLDTGAGDYRGQMFRIMEQSFERLGVERLPLIMLHNPVIDGETGDRKLSVRDALVVRDEMEALKEQGLCDWLGMTGLGDGAALTEVIETGRFDVAQVYYNMLNPTAGLRRERWNSTNFNALLEICDRHDMGVMGIRIFAGGHLASAERHGREIPVNTNTENAAEEARARMIWQHHTPEDGTPAQTALRFGLAESRISTVVVGLAELDHLRLAIEAVDMGPLPAVRLSAYASAWDSTEFSK
ncbi:MAG: aldo/keto reductase [Paracoccaceae bacterium]